MFCTALHQDPWNQTEVLLLGTKQQLAKVNINSITVGVAYVAGVERGRGKGEREKGRGIGERGEGSLSFPLFRAFLSPPSPPLFAPATQATVGESVVNTKPVVRKLGSWCVYSY